MTLLFSAAGIAPSQPPLLTRVDEIRNLTPAEASRKRAVRIEGVVTFQRPAPPNLFVQDSSGGNYVDVGSARPVSAAANGSGSPVSRIRENLRR
ncbi:MAG: hypothetical protein DMG57_34395 [Acidobacteria bacterium]|nr:MAG: hypothetical protein DMG57_34395 [Acidobacteriota bacterium]